MSLAQLYLTTNRPDKAASTLSDMPLKARSQPSLLATLVDLLTRGKAKSDTATKDAAVKALREGMAHWSKDSSAVGKQCYGKVLNIAAQTAERIGDWDLATEAYGAHLENCGDDSKSRILRGYVRALSVTDPLKAKKFMNRLKVPSLVTMDPEEIEQAAPPRLFNKTATASKAADKAAEKAAASAENTEETGKEKTEETETAKAKKKRKKKIRYPKDFDPENPGPPPDPERWIPKRERAGAKKKKGKNPMRGNQGATPGDDDFRNQKTSATVQASTDKKRKGRKKR
jgi:signal recognition particle subunit SRP72